MCEYGEEGRCVHVGKGGCAMRDVGACGERDSVYKRMQVCACGRREVGCIQG